MSLARHGFAFLAAFAFITLSANGSTITVNTTAAPAADGNCSLEEAVSAANNGNTGPNSDCTSGSGLNDVIQFAIPGAGVHTITLAATVNITTPMTIDGYTQTGASNASFPQTILIQVDAAGANAFVVTANNVTIAGLSIGNSNIGISISGSGCVVKGNFIGVSANGTTPNPNGAAGVQIAAGSTGSLVGGTSPGDRNVIAASGEGVTVGAFASSGAPNVISGNYIGVDASGASAGNSDSGVFMDTVGFVVIGGTTGTTPGGACTGACNVISGNIGYGVQVLGSTTTSVTIQGNLIGTNPGGTTAIGNGFNGINVGGTTPPANILIGGTTASARNVISANGIGGGATPGGILLANAQGVTIQGNYIGLDTTGGAALGNSGPGILLTGVPGSTGDVIGGTAAGSGNVISGNTSDGITFMPNNGNNTVQSNFIGTAANGTTALANGGNAISIISADNIIVGAGTIGGAGANTLANSGNAVLDNGGTGDQMFGNILVPAGAFVPIGLGGNAINPNDSCDADVGSNNLQNFPVITTAGTNGVTTTIKGTLNSVASSSYTVELYTDSTTFAPNGWNPFTTTIVNTDGTCNGSFFLTLAGMPAHSFVAGTATDAAGNTSALPAGVPLLQAPTVTETFTPSTVNVNSASTMTISITNANAGSALTVDFSDTYPGTLVNSAAPSSTCPGATLTSTAGTLALSGGVVPASGSCTVTATVQSASPGSFANPITVNSAEAGPSLTATATLTVNGPPTVLKSFAPNTIVSNQSSTLTITLANTSGTPYTAAGVVDIYPANLKNATTPAASTTCGGTVTAAAGGGSVSLAGGTIPAAGSCTVTVAVTSNIPGSFLNTIGVGAVTSSGPPNDTAATASVTVNAAAPTIAKAFSPTSIVAGATSTLTVTLSNTNGTADSAAAFTDNYPAGLVNATSPAPSTTCGGTVTATAGTSSLALSGGTIPANGSCTVTVTVTSASATSYGNTIAAGALTSSAGPNAAPANATLTVTPLVAPTVAKSFSPASILPTAVSTLTVTLTNPNAVALTSAAFSDTYPIGLVNDATPGAATTCGGTVTATAGSGSLALSGGTIPVSGSCTVTVQVTSAAAASYTNTIGGGAVTSSGPPNTNPASATLTVSPLVAPTVAKSFSPASIAIGGTSTLTVTLTNGNAVALTGAAFADNYPAGLANASSPAASTTCGGTVTAAAGTSSLQLSGGTIPPNGSCTVSVAVTSTIATAYGNTIGAGALTSSGPPNGTAANATLTVTATAPTVGMAFSPASIFTGGTSTLTITLSNANSVSADAAAFTDTYPAGLVNAPSPSASTTCGGTVTAAAGGGSVALSGGSIPASGSCTVTVVVTSAAPNAYGNSIAVGGLASNAGSNTAAANATLTVTALSTPGVSMAFSPTSILTGGTSTLTITLTNPNAVAATAAAFSDPYPSGLVNAATPAASTTCGGTVTASAAGTSVALSGGTIPANGNCSVSVSVTSAAAGAYANTIAAGGLTSSAGANAAAANATLTVTALSGPTVAMSFTPATVAVGASSTLTITLTNPNAVAATSLAFTNTYPSGLVNASTPSAATTCGGTVTAAASAGSLALSGGTLPASSSCTVTVVITSATAGSYANSIAAGAVTSSAPANAAAANATLTVSPLTAMGVSISFSPSSIFVNNSSLLTITLTNSNSQAINGVTFTNSYPAGMSNFTTPAGATTCGGTVTANAGGTSLALSGGSIPPNGSCTVTVFVTAGAAGSYTDSLAAGSIASTNAGANAAAAAALAVAGGVTGAPALPDWAPLFMALILGMLGVVVLKRS